MHTEKCRKGHGAWPTLAMAGLTVLASCLPLLAHEENKANVDNKRVQLSEKLGSIIPLDLTFIDEQGKPVVLKDLINKPTVLTLVYYRCPGICSPLLHELASVVDKCDLTPGVDYNLITISFDVREGTDLAQNTGNAIRESLKNKKVTPETWRFMTGDAENIRKITNAVGFEFKSDKEDFVHPTVVIFLGKDGKITRYLNGLEFLPADMKMAVIDASQGRARNFMHKLQRFCFSYDSDRRSYELQINRVILLGTLAFVAIFGVFLVVRGRIHHKK
jgi:protein SCO1/2